MADVMSVQVKTCRLRARPSFLAETGSTLKYGDRVTVGKKQDAWFFASHPAGEGWLHSSALTAKRVVLDQSAGAVSTSTSSDEIALAGKGFNEQVEERYKREGNIDFSWIDRMEKLVVPNEEMLAFLRDGGMDREKRS